MYDLEELKQGIEAVARHYEKGCLDRSPFHLSSCGGCGAPSFQQPCPLCRYYPRGSDKGYYEPKVATKQMFCEMIDRSGPEGRDGTIATWLIKNNDRRFPDLTQALTVALDVDVPSASDYWDAIVDGHTFQRGISDPAAYLGWSGMFEIKAVIDGGYGHGNPRLVPKMIEVLSTWVDAVHAGDAHAMSEAAAAGREIAAVALHSCQPVGNLRSAMERFDKVEEMLQSAALAP